MLISNEAQNYVAGQVLVSVDSNGNVIALTTPNGAVINVLLINNSGTLSVPTGNAPTANQEFSPLSCIWQLIAKCTAAATVTVSKVINNVTTNVGAITVPAGGHASPEISTLACTYVSVDSDGVEISIIGPPKYSGHLNVLWRARVNKGSNALIRPSKSVGRM